jgi:hypothetical protein
MLSERMLEWQDVKVSVNVPNRIREFNHDENPLVTRNAVKTLLGNQKFEKWEFANPTTSAYRPTTDEAAKRALKRSSSGLSQSRSHGSKRHR